MVGALVTLLAALVVASPARAGGEGRISVTVAVGGLSVDLLLSASQVPVGRPFLAVARVRNAGPHPVDGSHATLAYDRDGLGHSGRESRMLGVIRVGGSRWAVWALRARTPGAYVLVARAGARDRATGDLLSAESRAAIIVAQ